MSTCHYHPTAKAKFMCPDCGEDVCDVCRLEGGLQRCGHCAINGPPPGGPRIREPEPAAVSADGGGYDEGYAQGGYDQAGYDQAGGYGGGYGGGTPAAHDMSAMLEVRCANHPEVTADMQCLNCLQAYCMSCIPDGTMCAQCKLDPDGRAAPQEDYTPHPGVDVGYDPGMDFAGYDDAQGGGYDDGYADDFAAGYGDAPATPRPRKAGPKKAGAAGGKKGAAAGGKKGAAAKKKAGGGLPIPAIAGGVALLLALGGGGFWFMNRGGGEPFNGPAKVSITAPKGNLKGLQQITLKVASEDQLELVTINVDGKYWDKFKAPPFKSEWQTSMLKNGKHTIEAIAQYKNGPTVKDKVTVTTNNPR